MVKFKIGIYKIYVEMSFKIGINSNFVYGVVEEIKKKLKN